MSILDAQGLDEHADEHVDEEIQACLNFDNPVSFFLFAGAGSGKTRSLVRAVDRILRDSREYLLLRGKRIAVITYTNAACREIEARLEFDPLVKVSTIHSFIWDLIEGFHSDIRARLKEMLQQDITELNELLKKGRRGTKVEIDRQNSIASKSKRLERLDATRTFTYNPNGNSPTRDALNHSEVIKLGSYFLGNKPLMQRILVSAFPVLLIDESQDTNGVLLDSLFAVQKAHKGNFALGLFGDVMQRIYGDGKVNLVHRLISSKQFFPFGTAGLVR